MKLFSSGCPAEFGDGGGDAPSQLCVGDALVAG
jgi:hypothetical protein